MTSRLPAQCLFCLHWISPLDRDPAEVKEIPGTAGGVDQICSAFTQGIPDAIWWNRFDHRRSYTGDGGVRWAPDSDSTEFPEQALNT